MPLKKNIEIIVTIPDKLVSTAIFFLSNNQVIAIMQIKTRKKLTDIYTRVIIDSNQFKLTKYGNTSEDVISHI
jgi:hypothetical protein